MQFPLKSELLNSEYLELVAKGSINEDLIHEFKVKEYPLSTRDEKKDFLRDISAMINASGGVILLGISDDGEIEGVNIPDIDSYKRQMLQVINSNIEPQIIGVDFKLVQSNRKNIVMILVPQGDQKPYSLKINGEGREFLVRQNASNHHMSMSEIRRLFLLTPSKEDINEEWRNWKIRKVQLVKGNKWFKPLMNTKCVLIFIYPIESSPDDFLLETQKIENLTDRKMYIWPPRARGCTLIPFDKGIFTLGRDKGDYGINDPCYSFVLVENNSSFEIYDGMSSLTISEKKGIGPAIDNSIFTYVERAMGFYIDAGFSGKKYQVSLNLINVKGYKILRESFMYLPGMGENAIGIPDDHFEITATMKIGDDIKESLKPIFDKLWQTSGFSRCFRYDENGKFVGKDSEY